MHALAEDESVLYGIKISLGLFVIGMTFSSIVCPSFSFFSSKLSHTRLKLTKVVTKLDSGEYIYNSRQRKSWMLLAPSSHACHETFSISTSHGSGKSIKCSYLNWSSAIFEVLSFASVLSSNIGVCITSGP